jgi:hydroxyacyl-ACP dehydratase HTD2-like protein with hotdog domain
MTAGERPRLIVGGKVGLVERRATEIDLFRFSAATWNAHRIHYDEPRARAEGLPGAVVQAHLHGAWMARLATSIAGPGARLRSLDWTNRGAVVANETVSLAATVTGLADSAEGTTIRLELSETGADGSIRVTGSATVLRRGDPT